MIPDLPADEIARLYNNRAAVPEYEQFVDRWQARSSAWRKAARGTLDIAYGTAPRQKLDLFTPATSGPWPLMIFLHGGYWQYLCKEDWSCVAAPFIERGMACAIVGYTLCPETTVAGIVEEVRTACALLYAQAPGHGLDRTRFFVSGHSAGGHLTAMAFATDWTARDAALPRNLFRAGIAISGVFDLEPLTLTPLNDALRLSRESALAVSPIFQPSANGSNLLTLVGSAETAEFLRQSREFSAAWATPLAETAGENHFSVVDAFHIPGTETFKRAWSFIQQRLDP